MARQVLYLFFIFGFIPSLMFGQLNKQANHWYFGYNAGLDFSSGKPEPATDGALSIWEGCASISDENGNLLLYTDGRSIWNKKHQLIPDAINLGGHNSTTQSGTIVPQPGNPNIFYIFSVNTNDINTGIKGAQYAIVDLRLNNGFGGLISKNNLLITNSSESLTIVKHCNNIDYWVLTHEVGTKAFRAFLLTESGLNLNFVESKVGSINRTSLGYMKASPNGQKIVLALFEKSVLEVLQFNNNQGTLSNSLLLSHPNFKRLYGAEFSANNQFLYVTGTLSEGKQIYQLDITETTTAAILESKTVVGEITDSYFGALQLGPDNKIYASINNANYLGVINNPDQKGTDCQFIANGVSLGNKKSGIGLPNFIASNFNITPIASIQQTTDKNCNDVVLTANIDQKTTSTLNYQWFVDGKKVNEATNVSFKPGRSGSYSVSIKEAGQCSNDSVNSAPMDIKILEATPKFTNLGCNNALLKANANAPVKWIGVNVSSEKAIQDTLTVSGVNTQVYQLQIFHPDNATCSIQKNFTVTFSPAGIYNFGQGTLTACDTATLNAPINSKWDTYSWQRPDNSITVASKITGSQNGSYIITAKNSQSKCEAKDTVIVIINKSPFIKPNENFCLINSSLKIEAGTSENNLRYEWMPGVSKSAILEISKPGKYKVKATTAEGCSSSRSVEVFSAQKVKIGNDITVCEGEIVELSPTITNASPSILYKWSSGENTRTIKPSLPGIYKLTTKQFVCEISDSVKVTINPLPKIKADETVCLNKEIEAGGLESGLTYHWQHSAQTTANIPVTEEGIYKVDISTPQGCTSTRTITINEPCVSRIYAPDVFTPNEDGLNDVFRLIIVSGQAIGLDIYNRWGEKIFKNEQSDPQWDGKLNGTLLPEGTYPYVFRYKIRNNDTVFEFRGVITLQR
ncbi:gliding motility-associated C-terminal domain-containing protein [Runella sp.]|uniref:gliding motility-associated C-terminal domain-containing protein n=1 Tax=Runella sp. TaxID=1960881 RepID=UPI003D14E54E